jgi:choice-of-anchor B domain-containing protein
MLDLSDPVNPEFVGCHSDYYVHDTQCVVYRGPDVEHQGKEICFDSNGDEGTIDIVDVTDKSAPARLAREGYSGAVFTHQGWLTEDQAFFLLGDESDESAFRHGTRTYVWDVRDLDAPFVVGDYTADLLSTDHNLFIRGDLVYEANYSSGLRILRLGDLDQLELQEVGYFDTYPVHDDAGTTFGPWSVYPFFDSGIVVVSDILLGLFVLQPTLVPEPALAWLQLGAVSLVAGVARGARRRGRPRPSGEPSPGRRHLDVLE